jgi:hypothetical protein
MWFLLNAVSNISTNVSIICYGHAGIVKKGQLKKVKMYRVFLGLVLKIQVTRYLSRFAVFVMFANKLYRTLLIKFCIYRHFS